MKRRASRGAAVVFLVVCNAVVVPLLATTHKVVGHFEIGTTTYTFLGGPYRQKSLTYIGARRHVRLGDEIGPFHVHPYDPDRVLYEACPDRVSPKCGTYYFDGHTGKRHKVAVAGVIDQLDLDTQRPAEIRAKARSAREPASAGR